MPDGAAPRPRRVRADASAATDTANAARAAHAAGASGAAASKASAGAVVVYTDGACSGNPGPGGWAWAVPDGPYGSGSERHSTNQRMEVMAVLDALTTLGPRTPGPITVVSDSTYVVNCFRDAWWRGWLAREWRNSAKQPVANKDLWKPLIEQYRLREHTPGHVTFRWVKGHSGHPMNDRVDALAVEASRGLTDRRVVGFPDDAVPAEAPPFAASPPATEPDHPHIAALTDPPSQLGLF